MSILSEIIIGWKNYVFENPLVEEEAVRRITICVGNKCKQFTKNYNCDLCHCYMPAKVRSPKSKCKKGLW